MVLYNLFLLKYIKLIQKVAYFLEWKYNGY